MRKYGLKLPFPATLLPFYPLVESHLPVPGKLQCPAASPRARLAPRPAFLSRRTHRDSGRDRDKDRVKAGRREEAWW